MIDGLRPYAAYRASPDRWLTQFPSTWERLRIKYLLRELDRRTQTGEEPLLSMRRDHGLVPLSQFSDKVAESKALLAYKLVRPGELVVNRMQAGNGLVFVARIPGLISPDYAIFRPVREVNLDYLELLFRSYPLRAKFRSESTGLGTGTAGFLRLYGDSLGAIEIGLPSAEEQSLIVRFLEHADRRIGRYIRAKKKLIALLNEQKQAIIDRVVTRGLDPTVRLKPSGVEWLGDVPEHWVVASLRFRYHQCLGKMVDAKRTTGTRLLPYLRNVDVQWDRINAVNLPQIDITAEEHERYTVRVGDLLVCEGRHLGRAAFWRGELPTCAFQKALHRLRPRDPANDSSRYLFYCLHVVHFKDAFGASSDDNSIPHLTGEMLRAHKFPFPPSEEQRSIALHLDERVAALNRARAAVESEIESVREYRTRLIADVVTGKIDVREAAAHLPDAPRTLEDDGLLLEEGADSDSPELNDREVEVIA